MTLEVELKLFINSVHEVPTEAMLMACWQPLLAKPVEVHPPKSLLNAYFETHDQWFRRHDCGLRTRLRSGRYEQTIKLAGQQQGAAHIRPEYNQPCQSVTPILADFPPEIWPPETDVSALQQQLLEMFCTDFVRHSYGLTLHDGSVVEAVLDVGTVVAGQQQSVICELELELQQGNVQSLFTLARAMLADFALSLGFLTKAERGYRLAQQQPLTWLNPPSGASLADQLRAMQQNIWLQTDEPSRLQMQWQQLQDALVTHAAPIALRQRAQSLVPSIAGDFQLWLLDFSAWLLEDK